MDAPISSLAATVTHNLFEAYHSEPHTNRFNQGLITIIGGLPEAAI